MKRYKAKVTANVEMTVWITEDVDEINDWEEK